MPDGYHENWLIEVKAERLRVSREVWDHFEEEGLGFLQQLVIGDETWVHHYDPEYYIIYFIYFSAIAEKRKIKYSLLTVASSWLF
jgi:hypothetical protein